MLILLFSNYLCSVGGGVCDVNIIIMLGCYNFTSISWTNPIDQVIGVEWEINDKL